MEKAMALHSSVLAWKIPWTEEPGRLQSMGSRRVGHDWATSLSLSLSCIGEGNGNPLQCSRLENPREGGAWWAAVYGVAQSRTRLKRLGSNIGEYHRLGGLNNKCSCLTVQESGSPRSGCQSGPDLAEGCLPLRSSRASSDACWEKEPDRPALPLFISPHEGSSLMT